MSQPIDPKSYSNPARGALDELLSAISALNMHPKPIDPENQVPNNEGYLSQTDHWAEHAVEHMRAAVQCLHIHINQESFSVTLLKRLLADGKVTDNEMFAMLSNLEDNNRSPGEERDLHMRYLKFRHQMEVDGNG